MIWLQVRPALVALLIVEKKDIRDCKKISSIAKIFIEICKPQEPEGEHSEYGLTVANTLHRMTLCQAALARCNIENILFNIQFGTPTLASSTPRSPLTQENMHNLQVPKFWQF